MRAPLRGTRLEADAAFGHWHTQTVIVGLSVDELKAHLRPLKVHTLETLVNSVTKACDLFTPKERMNFFKAAGYAADEMDGYICPAFQNRSA